MTSWTLYTAAQAVRHEPEKLCHTRPGDEPFKTETGNKCISEKAKKKLFDGLRSRRTENSAKITVGFF